MKLEPGTHRGVLVDVGCTQSKKKGTLGIVLTFNCLDDDNNAFAQTRVTKWVTENTLEYVLKDLVFCGLKKEVKEIFVLADEDAISKYFDQNVVSLEIDYEEYDGKQYLRVQFINREGGASYEKISIGESKKQFGGLNIKGMLAKVRKDNPTPKATSNESEEVPF